MERLECLDKENIEPRATVNEGLGDEDVADGGRAQHGKRAHGGRELKVVLGVKGDSVLRPHTSTSYLLFQTLFSCFGL